MGVNQAGHDTGQPPETAPSLASRMTQPCFRLSQTSRRHRIGWPFNGGSAKYGGVAGHAVSWQTLEAIDACVKLLISTGAAAGAASRPDWRVHFGKPIRMSNWRAQPRPEEALLSCPGSRHSPTARDAALAMPCQPTPVNGGHHCTAGTRAMPPPKPVRPAGHLIADWFGISGSQWTQKRLRQVRVRQIPVVIFLWTLRPNRFQAALPQSAVGPDVEGFSPSLSADQAAEELDAEGKSSTSNHTPA